MSDFAADAPPATPIRPAPVFVWPPQPAALLRFVVGVPGYFLPLNILYMGSAILTWFFLTPSLDRMATWSWDWVAIVYARNLAMTFLVFGGLHLRFYILKSQGTRFMLSRREPTTRHKRYWFGSQVRENVFWTAGSGVGTFVSSRSSSMSRVGSVWASSTRITSPEPRPARPCHFPCGLFAS